MLTHLKAIYITILLCISTAIFSAEPCQKTWDIANAFQLQTKLRPSEGFGSGTMVQTPYGYQPIEQLTIGGMIDGYNGQQEILYLKKDIVDEYFVIQIDQQYLKVGPSQKFYLQNNQLQTADQLQIGDQLENGLCVYNICHVQEPCTMHCLSTQDQSFYLYPDIHVHNFDVVTLGTAAFTLSLGIIEISNPITLAVGGVLLLSWYRMQYFKQVIAPDFEFDNEDPDLTAQNLSLHNNETLQATRTYYLTKRQALIDTYQELIKLNSGILVALRPSTNNYVLFASNFLSPLQPKQYKQPTLPNLSYECNLSSAQKVQLLSARDTELETLQQEIMDLHLIIAFYTNEAIERRDLAKTEYDETCKHVDLEVSLWNYDPYNISCQIALDQYAAHFMWQDVLDTLEIKTKEVQCIINYYQTLHDHFFATKTTNLSMIITDQIKINNSYFDTIKRNRLIWHSNMLITEDFLRKQNLLSQKLINQIKGKIQQQRSAQEKEAISLAKNKQNAAHNAIKDAFRNNPPQQTPNIKGPDQDPEDDLFEKLKKTYAKKGRTKQFGNIYKDPKTGYWWSQSKGPHAAPHYKVYQERATGLEWMWDVDTLGKIMNKHKGPIGRFIPYKDIIFLS